MSDVIGIIIFFKGLESQFAQWWGYVFEMYMAQ